MDLSYIIAKVESAQVSDTPFKHLEIDNLFEEADFQEIINSPEIATKEAPGDVELFNELFSSGYRIIDFPGCTSDHNEYIRWHQDKRVTHKSDTSCEGFGVVLRLASPNSKAITQLQQFLSSQEFVRCIASKFNIDSIDCNYDAGIQKYLDGYEISPHPDIRKKALTFMVNINPSPTSSDEEYHTSYLKFKPQWSYVEEFWNGNPNSDRCWVPWDWCEIKKQQRNNNSIVIFSPDNNTLHAVKANYNHLAYQRTQLYGNLWHKEVSIDLKPKWEDYVIGMNAGAEIPAGQVMKSYLKKVVPGSIKDIIRRPNKTSETTHLERKY